MEFFKLPTANHKMSGVYLKLEVILNLLCTAKYWIAYREQTVERWSLSSQQLIIKLISAENMVQLSTNNNEIYQELIISLPAASPLSSAERQSNCLWLIVHELLLKKLTFMLIIFKLSRADSPTPFHPLCFHVPSCPTTYSIRLYLGWDSEPFTADWLYVLEILRTIK